MIGEEEEILFYLLRVVCVFRGSIRAIFTAIARMVADAEIICATRSRSRPREQEIGDDGLPSRSFSEGWSSALHFGATRSRSWPPDHAGAAPCHADTHEIVRTDKAGW
jgi:hypothetical protein